MDRIDIFPTIDGEKTYINIDGLKLAALIAEKQTDSVDIEVRHDIQGKQFPVYLHYRNILRHHIDGIICLVV